LTTTGVKDHKQNRKLEKEVQTTRKPKKPSKGSTECEKSKRKKDIGKEKSRR